MSTYDEQLAAWTADSCKREMAQDQENYAFEAWWDAFKVLLGSHTLRITDGKTGELKDGSLRDLADFAEREYRLRFARRQTAIEAIWKDAPPKPEPEPRPRPGAGV